MKPSKEAIERGATAILLAFSEVRDQLHISRKCAVGLATVAIEAAIEPGDILEDGPGSPEHPVGLIYLDKVRP